MPSRPFGLNRPSRPIFVPRWPKQRRVRVDTGADIHPFFFVRPLAFAFLWSGAAP